MNILQRIEKAERLATRVAAREAGPACLRKLSPEDALMTFLQIKQNGDLERLTDAAYWALTEQAGLRGRIQK